ncbi:MAG TPA: nitroreductase family protein [Actinomycetota bacterium]|nr:nitroreductase family protein [Actinomycetota bacterium]
MGDDLSVFDAVHSLRAIRAFEPDPVPEEAIASILEAGTRAPSPQNSQPWAFIVVRDPATRAQIAEIYRRVWNIVKEPVYGDINAIEDTSQRRLLQATDRLAAAVDEAPLFIFAMLDRSKLGVMVTPDLQTLLEPSSAYGAVWAAIENMLLAARALEVGAISTNLTRLMDVEVRAILDYPEHVETVSMLALGRPRAPSRFGPTTRRPVSDVAHTERWGAPF